MSLNRGAILRIGLDSLRASPLRTGLSTLGVIIGVASLVAILSLGDGLERFSRAQIRGTTDLLLISVQPITTDRVDGIAIVRSDPPRMNASDATDLARALGDADVTLMLEASGWLSLAGDTTRIPTLVSAALPTVASFMPSSLRAGRLIDQEDIDRDRPVALVSTNVSAKLGLQPDSLLAGWLTLDGARYRVIGTFEAGPQDPARLLVPLTRSAETRWRRPDRAATLLVQARRIEDVEHVRVRVEEWLSGRYADAGQKFRVGSNNARAAQARQGILLFKLTMGAIAGISLLVGGIGIMNIMLASVAERTREIGIRKAAGARAHDILLQFLWESVAITGAGAAVGVVLGLTGAFAITAGIRRLTEATLYAGFSWSTVVVAAGTAMFVGLAFGTYPARRAARLSPIDAMRHE